ncbi:hypothetical protein OGAPHI_005723 [Ogataea philodendri]|uniref:Uncharacterized protein n=1 Tax=Ogataea philodendri TaxID=1378263 RepID=A0A9P8P060_9ASCO|nr:uncharacterized protein OGAPHI_005723 [Ogataea philodendri]KAH3662471.1 hypothetical protein OGAPHI_005723 [Ogataea philodendri]
MFSVVRISTKTVEPTSKTVMQFGLACCGKTNESDLRLKLNELFTRSGFRTKMRPLSINLYDIVVKMADEALKCTNEPTSARLCSN